MCEEFGAGGAGRVGGGGRGSDGEATTDSELESESGSEGEKSKREGYEGDVGAEDGASNRGWAAGVEGGT